MSIPNGIQSHVLWTMDGRTWIENVHAATSRPSFQRALDRGYARLIPQDAVTRLVIETRKQN